MVCALAVPASADGNDPIDPEKVMQEMFYRNCMKDGNEHLVPDWFREQYEKEHPATPKPVEQYYPDVAPDAWYAEAVNALTEGGLLNGYPDGLFHPDDYITQGQLAKILCEIHGFQPVDWESARDGGQPINLDTHWALRHLWALQMKYAYRAPENDGSTLDDPVWRGDAVSVLVNTVARFIGTYPQSYVGSDRAKALEHPYCMLDHKTMGYKPAVSYYSYETDEWSQITEKIWTESDIPDWEDVANTPWATQNRIQYEHYDSPEFQAHKENGDRAWTREHENDYMTSTEWLEQIGHDWNSSDILLAYNLGITQGIDANGTCAPRSSMTRAELCQILYNMGVIHSNDVPGVHFYVKQ